MLGRPRVCRAAEIGKIPLITAHRAAVLDGCEIEVRHPTNCPDWGVRRSCGERRHRPCGPGAAGIAVLAGGPANVNAQALAASSLFRINSRALTGAARRDARVAWAK